ncbi:MAG: SCP2 sterol-binding domain-containing protein [Gammaproteobacteria bacterium]|nr:SCP2 sterol-binding domain-containing protein [Boseongicola sp. SB0665_bin_10]MYF49804.1 SCP2 sterol-binding domain-containing protein [Gammaproteobacteria bacterium]
MSDAIDEAVTMLNSKLDGGFDGTAKFVIEDEGSILLDEEGARASDDEAEVTMTADAGTFRDILDGDLDPTVAFASGRLKVDGDIGVAMRLVPALA